MKLYIPTCSLNINNILSTDSISPAALYPTRITGNKRFFQVEACPSDQAIFLYSKIPSYKVNMRDMENHRIVIAIDANKIGQKLDKIDTIKGVDVYTCSSTIYFTPSNAYFLFETKFSYQSCLVNAEQSVENKSFSLYKKVLIKPSDEFKWDKTYCKKFKSGNCCDGRTDTIIDGIKGAIVGYYAGLKMVKSPDLAILKKDAKKIKNIFSALTNSATHRFTEEQDRNLTPIVKEFSETFTKIDPVFNHNQKVIEARLTSSLENFKDKITISELKCIIERLGLTKYLMKILNLEEPFNIYSLYDIINSNQYADLLSIKMSDMYRAISRIEVNLSANNNNEITINNTFRIKEDDKLEINEDGSIDGVYNAFINSFIEKRYLEDSNKPQNLSIALLGGQIIKSSHSEEEWEKSTSREYINSLLNNIQNGTSFDVVSTDQDVLQALAAFSLKGNDIDKLSDFITQNGITECKYAWGLFGAAYGYSLLPKTFTKGILTEKVLSDIFSILFPQLIQNGKDDTSSDNEDLSRDLSIIPDKKNDEPKVITALRKHGLFTKKDQKEAVIKESTIETKSDDDFEKAIKLIRIGKRSIPDKQIKVIVENYNASGRQVNEYFFNRISKANGIGKGTIEAIRNHFNIKPVVEKTLFDEQLLFINDNGLEKLVKELRIGDPNVEEIIINNIIYIQGTHKKYPHPNNYDCIDHLHKLLLSNTKYALPKKTQNNIQIVNKLIELLKNRYNI